MGRSISNKSIENRLINQLDILFKKYYPVDVSLRDVSFYKIDIKPIYITDGNTFTIDLDGMDFELRENFTFCQLERKIKVYIIDKWLNKLGTVPDSFNDLKNISANISSLEDLEKNLALWYKPDPRLLSFIYNTLKEDTTWSGSDVESVVRRIRRNTDSSDFGQTVSFKGRHLIVHNWLLGESLTIPDLFTEGEVKLGDDFWYNVKIETYKYLLDDSEFGGFVISYNLLKSNWLTSEIDSMIQGNGELLRNCIKGLCNCIEKELKGDFNLRINFPNDKGYLKLVPVVMYTTFGELVGRFKREVCGNTDIAKTRNNAFVNGVIDVLEMYYNLKLYKFKREEF